MDNLCPDSVAYADLARMDSYDEKSNDFPKETRLRIYSDLHNVMSFDDSDENIAKIWSYSDHSDTQSTAWPVYASNTVSQVVAQTMATAGIPAMHGKKSNEILLNNLFELKSLHYDFIRLFFLQDSFQSQNFLKDPSLKEYDHLVGRLIKQFNAWEKDCEEKNAQETDVCFAMVKRNWLALALKIYYISSNPLLEFMSGVLDEKTYEQFTWLTRCLREFLDIRYFRKL